MEAIKVPHIWYKEMANELARSCMDSKLHVIDLRKRIELMKVGTPSEHDVKMKITLEQLLGWLDKADSEEIARKKYDDFKVKYAPDKSLKGDLKAAKKEVLSLKKEIQLTTSIHDEFDPYNVIGKMSDKYYLSNGQIDSLMMLMDKHGLIY